MKNKVKCDECKSWYRFDTTQRRQNNEIQSYFC